MHKHRSDDLCSLQSLQTVFFALYKIGLVKLVSRSLDILESKMANGKYVPVCGLRNVCASQEDLQSQSDDLRIKGSNRG